MKKVSILFLNLFVLISCSKDDDKETVDKSRSKAITTFVFTAAENEALSTDVKATIDMDKKTINAEVPFSTDITSLKPSITISEDAKVSPADKKEQDFSETVTYTVTAEDSSEQKYTVHIDIASPTDRQVLIEIYNANPENTLGWDLEEQDISKWEGVTVTNDKVVALSFQGPDDEGVNISVLPAPIQYLTSIEKLYLSYNPIKVLPEEIGNLVNLVELGLFFNELTSLPSEIGNLVNLEVLTICSNELDSLPNEFWQLTKLKDLELCGNSLTSISNEIINLKELESLNLNSNSLTGIPPAVYELPNLQRLEIGANSLSNLSEDVGNLTRLQFLSVSNNSLTSIPSSIGNLTLLVGLSIQNNQITTVPQSIGNLTLLRSLQIQNNQITRVPQSVCDLSLIIFNKDDTAICEGDLIDKTN